MNSDLTQEKLIRHFGHKIVIAKYGSANLSLECETCHEVLADSDIETESDDELKIDNTSVSEREVLEFVLNKLGSIMLYPYAGTLPDEDLDNIESIGQSLRARIDSLSSEEAA